MKVNDIPKFIEEVFNAIENGIQLVAQHRHDGANEGQLVHVGYPKHVDMQLNIERLVPGEVGEPDLVEHEQVWVKIPWPTRVS